MKIYYLSVSFASKTKVSESVNNRYYYRYYKVVE
jgi:hypothetical protein